MQNNDVITAVGIDVSKRKSMVAIRRPGGEIVLLPFEVKHDISSLTDFIKILRQIGGDIRIVMEHTGIYWYPIARILEQSGFFVSVVNAILIYKFSDNSLRKVKTDRADSLKIANYALTFWDSLKQFKPEDETRILLKTQCRLYERTIDASVVLRNGLTTLLEQSFPGVDKLFSTSVRSVSGHYKWVDFVKRFWHKDCVAELSLRSFADCYEKWCRRCGYRFSASDANRIHDLARKSIAIFPKNESTHAVIAQSIDTLNAIYDALQIMRNEMSRLASMLPEYPIVMEMFGVGPVTGPQLISEIGDVRRFTSKRALVAFVGVDAPPFQSGSFDSKSRHISKRGTPRLRKTAFLICSVILQHCNMNDPIYAFMDKKRSEGKHYYVYMVAGAAKFLRIYYARIKEHLDSLNLIIS